MFMYMIFEYMDRATNINSNWDNCIDNAEN